MKRLICVEDDTDILELLEYTLKSYGFDVAPCENASEFYAALKDGIPSLVLLDIMLPDKNGMQILKDLRADPLYKTLPVIVLTAKSGQMDKIKGLDGGADDYITKPFDIMELVSRVNAVLRRTAADLPQDRSILFHDLSVDPDSREVRLGDEKIVLTYKEFELLYILVSNVNKVQTRDTLMNKIWGTEFEGESRTLDVHVRSLRHKLGDCGQYIETVRNVGYKAVL